MKVFTFIKQNLGLLFAPALILALASCSSYQYSGYEADGIYGESRPGIWEQQEQPQKQEVRPNNNNTYYKNLFAQQSEMYGEILDSDIFTDVESYTSTNPSYSNYLNNGENDGVAYSGGYAPWGNDPDTYTVNIYNNGFYNPWYYGYGYGYGYYGYGYGYGYGYPYYGGWYNPYRPYWGGGFYSPIAYGYGPYWNIGFGYGYGYSPYYYPYYNHYFSPYYNNYHHNNRISYNATRRSEPVRYSEGVSRRSSDLNSRTSSYSRSIRDIRNSRTSNAGTSRTRSSNDNDVNVYARTSRRTEASPVYNSGSNSSNSRSYQTRSRSSSNNTYSRSSSQRSAPARTTTRSSSPTTRSSGTVRSSSSGSRSSRGGRGGRGGI